MKFFYLVLVIGFLISCGDEKTEQKARSVNFKVGSGEDQDGNVFKTVTYQDGLNVSTTWMSENLASTKYRNGDMIFHWPEI